MLLQTYDEWQKYRICFEGGDVFKNTYINKLSADESDEQYIRRLQVTPDYPYCSTVIDRYAATLQQRFTLIQREATKSYISAAKGSNGGVDLFNTDANTFFGNVIATELLVTARVGVLVDNYADLGSTAAEKGDKHPFFVVYKREDIIKWKYSDKAFVYLRLREYVDGEVQYKTFELTDVGVFVSFEKDNGTVTSTKILPLKAIPFHLFELRHSLLKGVAGLQITLSNLESVNVNFLLFANTPIFYEPYRQREEPPGLDTPKKTRKIESGKYIGIRIPHDSIPPGFLSPVADISNTTSKKIEQLEATIEKLVALNLSFEGSRSADSKRVDNEALEAGLVRIGNIIKAGEVELVKFWHDFESDDSEPNIVYPRTYNITSDEQRLEKVEKLKAQLTATPSETFKREILKQIATILLDDIVDDTTLSRIITEINTSETLVGDVNIILKAFENILIDGETAAILLGFTDPGTVAKARAEQLEKVKATIMAQGGEMNPARGAKGMPGKTGTDEKEGKPGRGEGEAI